MLESRPVPDGFRTIPWLLVVGGAMLAVLLAYVLFAGYVPAKQHITRLEAELKDVYTREAALQKRVADLEDLLVLRDKQIAMLQGLRGGSGRRTEPDERAPARSRRPAAATLTLPRR
jgi:hypothetical protein